MRRFRSQHDLLHRRVRAAEADVLSDCARPQPRFLQHHAVALPQAFPGHAADIFAVHQNLARVRVVKAHQQVDERRFPAPRRAHDGHAHSGLSQHGQMLDERPVLLIRKGYVPHFHLTLYILKLLFSFRGLRGRFDQLKHAPRADQRVLQFRHDARNFIERARVLAGVGEKTRQIAHGHAAVDDGQSAENSHARVHQRVDEPRDGIGDGGIENSAQGRPAQAFIFLIESGKRAFLVAKGGNHFFACDQFIRERRLSGARLRLHFKHLMRSGRNERRRQKRYGRHQHHDQRNARADAQHEKQRAHNGQNPGKKLGKAKQQSVCELIDVRHHPADRFAERMAVQISERQPGQAVKRAKPQITDGQIRHFVADYTQKILRRRRQTRGQRKQGEGPRKRSKIDVPRTNDLINRPARQNGHAQRESHIQQRRYGGHKQKRAVPAHKGQHFFERSRPFFFLCHACAASFGNCAS